MCVLPVFDVPAPGIHREFGQTVGIIVVIAVMVHPVGIHIGIQRLVSFPVGLDCVQQFLPRDYLLIEHQLFNGA